VKGKVKQILQIKGRSLSVMLMVAALGAMLVGLLASTPATAQDGWSVPDYGPDPTYDYGTGCDWASAPDCSLDGGGATASPNPSPSPSPTPNATPAASAAQDQYQERPDTDGKAVAPAETTQAKQLPNTGPGTDGKAAAPAQTTEATGLPETNRNSSMLPLVLGSGALLVGGGLLARRLIR
jgi:LPXTG-motif cell wall-anchored protein